MKKTLIFTISLLMTSVIATAGVRSVTEEYQGNFLKYPFVKLTKEGIAHKINKDIEHSKENLKKKHFSMLGAADKISMSYKLLLENNDRLNFLLYSYTYNNGAAHGQYYTEGFSYDLHNGKKASSEAILEKLEPELLDRGVREGRFKLTDGDNNPRKLTDFWKVETISSECLINKDGSLTLIYQPYDLAPYAYGNTFITIPNDELSYLTGKRQHLVYTPHQEPQLNPKQLAAEEKAMQRETKLQQKREQRLLKNKEKLDQQQETLQLREAKKHQELMQKQSRAYEKQTQEEAKLQQKQTLAKAKEQEKQNKALEKQSLAKAKEQEKQNKAFEKQSLAKAKEQEKQNKALEKQSLAKAKEQEKQNKALEKQSLAKAKEQEKQSKALEKSRTKAEYQSMIAEQKQQMAKLKANQKAQNEAFKTKHNLSKTKK